MYRLYDMDPIAVDPNGICEAQTTAGAADLVLNGDLCDLGTAGVFNLYDAGYSSGIGGVRIAIDSAGDVATVVFTVYGTDQDGVEVTETITGVTTTEIESVTYWQTITRIAADAEVTSTVTVGTVDEIVSPTLPVNWRNDFPAVYTVASLSGTLQYDIQQTLSPMEMNTDPTTLIWYDAQSNKSAVLAGEFTRYVTAVRLKWDSYSSGAELQFQVREQDYNS